MNISSNSITGRGPQAWIQPPSSTNGFTSPPVDSFTHTSVPLPFSPPAFAPPPQIPQPAGFPSRYYGPPDPWFMGDVQPWSVPAGPRQAWIILPDQRAGGSSSTAPARAEKPR